jgi:hypothetical protein
MRHRVSIGNGMFPARNSQCARARVRCELAMPVVTYTYTYTYASTLLPVLTRRFAAKVYSLLLL